MVFRLKSKAALHLQAPAIPGGCRIYAVGDIHGRADLLEDLARQIEVDLAIAPAPKALAIFLGDYIDRGLQSAEVVDRLSRGHFPTQLIALRGNHEQILLDALVDETVFGSWRQFGGLELLASYGVDISDVIRGKGYKQARAELVAKLPARHRAFFESLPTSYSLGDYFFCHAGVRPGVSLSAQRDKDLMWIRQEFLDVKDFFGKVVVHGHAATDKPQLLANRINIDTGAYATGNLTCLVLEGASQRLLSTNRLQESSETAPNS